MEVLNQNQRRSAFWRVILLAGFIIFVLSIIMGSTYINYIASGEGELQKFEEKKIKENNLWDGESQQYKNTINDLKKEIIDCKAKAEKPDVKLEKCQDRLEGKDERIEELTEELKTCEASLKVAKSLN